MPELVYCAICGGPRSPSSGRLCRHCYLGVATYRRLIRVLKKILKGKKMAEKDAKPPEEVYSAIGPNTTIAELVAIAGENLVKHGMQGFEFSIPGEIGKINLAGNSEPKEKIIMHFTATIEKVGTS